MDALSARLAAVAAGQHALITLDQLVALKVTRHQREHLLASRQIVRVAKDVYRLNGAPATWQSRVAAAELPVGEHAIVSHRSAAALYGPDGFDQQRTVHLSLPVGHSPRKQKDVRIHRCADYDLIAPERRQNIPVTDPVRDANLAIAGWLMVHVTWAQLQNDPAGVVRRIRRALESRGSLGR